VKKRKSGTETRQRTERLDLRLLPAEHRALRLLADQAGHRSVQAWILEAIGPHLDGASN
jgi:predicted HicB family RNase H-like nuclease